MTRLTMQGALALLALAGAHVAGAQTIAITGGKVFPVRGAPIENGTVVIRDGKIVAVGANVAVPAGAQRVDATGKWVTPGLIDAATQLGVVEIGSIGATRDASARGHDAIAAAFTVWDGLNPNSVLLAPAREDGITTVVVQPTGGLVSGQAAVMDIVPGTTSDMIRRSPVAMVAEIGDARQAGVQSRGELLGKLRELLSDTRFYMTHRAAYETADTRQLSGSRADLEAMIPVLEGRLPLLVEVEQASDIDAAMHLASQYRLKLMIAGGAEAWMVADRLAAAKVPVLTGAMNNIPYTFAQLGARQENAALLRKAGVAVTIIGNAGGGDEETFNVRNVRFEAGNAVAYGMSWDDALRAITLAPAEAFGVGASVGALAPGMDANVVVWSGDPFEFSTRAEHVYVHGREHTEATRQRLLEDRYKTLPPDYTGAP